MEQILADLEILRSATHFYLLYQPAVLDDLGITDQQRPAIEELTARVGQEWLDSFKDIGLTSATERARRTLAQARANDARLSELLTPAQHGRLRPRLDGVVEALGGLEEGAEEAPPDEKARAQ